MGAVTEPEKTDIKKGLDFRGNPKTLFDALWQISEDYRKPFDKEAEDAYKLYYGYIDLANRLPNRALPFINKTFAMIETITPYDVKSLFGDRPYWPIEPGIDALRGATSAMEELQDRFAEENKFFNTGTDLIKGCRLVGTWCLEPFWDVRPKMRKFSKTNKIKGFEVGETKGEEKWLYEGLNWRNWAPWMTGVDPFQKDIQKMRWFYLKQPISKQDLDLWMKFAKYKKTTDQLTPEEKYGDLGRSLMGQLGKGVNANETDMGMLIRLWCPQVGRYMEVWNGEDVIRDDRMPYPFVPVVRFADTEDPFPNMFYAIGSVKPVASIQHYMNDLMGYILDQFAQTVDGVVLYENGAFDPDSLVMTAGNRIPFNNPYGRDISQMIQEFKLSGVSKDSLELYSLMEEKFDNVARQSSYQRGEVPDREEKAYNVRVMKEAGDAAIEVKLRLAEKSLEETCMMNLQIIGDNITQETLQRVLGDKARYYMYRDPSELPGGFEFRLKGSDKMAGKEQRYIEKTNLFTLVANDINRAEFAKVLVEDAEGVTDDQKKRILSAPPQPMAMPGMEGMQGAPQQQQTNPPMMPQGASEVTKPIQQGM